MIRSALSDHECLIPRTIEEALEQRTRHAGLVPIAGGTEVMVWMNDGKAPTGPYQSLHLLEPHWRSVRFDHGALRIGALATYTDVRFHAAVVQHFPLLVESARVTGALQIQNRATIVGNVANGSPAADTVPVLMAYDARLRIRSLTGMREVPLAEFYLGYRKTVLRSDELIEAIVIPQPEPDLLHYYRKVGTREAQAISKVVIAGVRSATLGGATGTVRLALGSVGPTTLRAHKTEHAILRGASAWEAKEVLRGEITPIDDIRSTGTYRRQVAENLLVEFLK
jgi:CO/xanthine dehydrogenase FAD-binding subunit